MRQKRIALISRSPNYKLRRPETYHDVSRSVEQFSTLATICRQQHTRVNLEISMIKRYVLNVSLRVSGREMRAIMGGSQRKNLTGQTRNEDRKHNG